MNTFQKLKEKFKGHSGKVGILGLGYVGLPLACEFAKAGFWVTGFEVDASKVKSLLAGKSYIGDIENQEIRELVKTKHLGATTDFEKLSGMDAIIVCVPTPLNKTKDPDISYIDLAARKISKVLHRGQLIILESTTYPGTTRENVLPLLEGKGFKVGTDFFLAFSPERIDPGNQQYKLPNTPKVVGGITPHCKDLAAILYGQIVKQVVPVSSAEAAELTKILENTFRAVNIALIDEWEKFARRIDVDLFEVLKAIRVRPTHQNIRYPGLGVGGNCLSKDPMFGSTSARDIFGFAEFDFPLSTAAVAINSTMPAATVALLEETFPGGLAGKRVLILGASYREDVGDTRHSPSITLAAMLAEKRATVAFADPLVDAEIGVPLHRDLPDARGFDAVILAVGHKPYRAIDLAAWSGAERPVVLDANGVLSRQQLQSLRDAGFKVAAIGRGSMR